jgi:hypothetical protein
MPADTTTTAAGRGPTEASRTGAVPEGSAVTVEEAERRSGWRTIRKVAPYLWPDDKPWVKRRVVMALLALFLAKVVAVGTPFFYKAAVDALSETADDAAWMLAFGAVGLTVAYGMARADECGLPAIARCDFCARGVSGRCASLRWKPSNISTRCR